ncbi:hypothetical protein [Deinococcus sp.]|uniref:hypothetical protein n=1 Tax=Deinococcus sp. TaxID=47478 RepID=UPI0025E44B7F|nr:hypothetical protein [Deinococcus sp.]
MTTDTPSPALTSLTVLAARCDACGAVPALDLPGGYLECARCHARRVMLQGAEDHLAAELAPVLAAWAHHWSAAGLSRAQLAEVLDLLTYRARTYEACAALLDETTAAYPAPEYRSSRAGEGHE